MKIFRVPRNTTGQKARRRRRRAVAKISKHKADTFLRPAEVELLRSLWDTGMWSTSSLADKFEVPKSVVEGLVAYKIHS